MADFVLKLAETVKSTAGVRTAYGDPVTLDDVTVIPVALAWFGFGGGEGEQAPALGSGGGGGGASIPIGAYIKDKAGVRFEPNPIALLAVAIPFAWVTTRGVALVFRSLRGRRR
ncbi:hypothetical protein HII28_03300 [Planctomonas sp. JC2975]|uniref:hypothetical protein n=1 Tax=Planctomonas sp. JC2975 TaxID=2729626 RepID=UPI0014745BE9|nr:hypothetical protein [Planctomonas sp. JC2975]NNC10905.1 hypothetical protein [Planctomonas sp. JC2975]